MVLICFLIAGLITEFCHQKKHQQKNIHHFNNKYEQPQ